MFGGIICATLLCIVGVSRGAVELLRNHDMEMADFTNNWKCQTCTMTTTITDKYNGRQSIMVTNRHHNADGPVQDVPLTAHGRYNFTAFIKILNLAPGHMYHAAELGISCTDGHGHHRYTKFGHEPYVRLHRWTELGGITSIPAGTHSCHVNVRVSGAAVNYLVDQTSLQLVPDLRSIHADWATAIDQIRKANITIRLTGTIDANANHMEVELTQTSHEFAFGSAVGATQIVDPHLKPYQDCFYDNFEWAVLENALKWKQMERHKGQVNYARPLTALQALQSRGIKVRGHNIIWGVERHVQAWVRALNTSELGSELDKHVHDVVTATKDKVLHWDVNNENLHGDWYEQRLHDANITMKMFHMAHAADPRVKLFLNEYSVVSHCNAAMALKNQALLFKESGVPVYGIGIQSHIRQYSSVDLTTIRARLDTVAAAGLPIWITELSVSEANVTLKARALTDLLTLYFSHPAVQGVLLWGFWDGKIFDQNTKLFEGPSVTPNAAGRAYQTLFKKTWRTHVTHVLHGHHPITVRGFKGGYTMKISRNGHVIKTEQFTLDSRGKDLEIHMDGQGGAGVIVG